MIELRHITRLHEVMCEEYGEHFTKAYGKPEEWLEALKDFTAEDIARGIKRMKEHKRKVPPYPNRFIDYIKSSPHINHEAYKPRKKISYKKSEKDYGKECLGNIKELLK